MKDIVILAHYCRNFSETDNGRFMYLCENLAKDNCVEIISSDFDHGKMTPKDSLTRELPFKVTFLHEPGYKKNISIKRLLSNSLWGKEVKKYLNCRKKPDVIYSAVPSLTGPYKASIYCKKNNVPFIVDIQDIWPEAFYLALNIPLVSNILFSPFKMRANAIYRHADAICAVSETYAERALLVNRKTNKCHVVFLGTDLGRFDRFAKEQAIHKPDNEFWIAYCGTLGASYDISSVIDALSILQQRGLSNIKFIILGNGEKRLEFEEYAKSLNVNCCFKGRLPYNQMCGWLSSCDIAVNPIMHNAAQSIINKHADYVAAGLPVINTQECLEYRKLVEEYDMGFNCANGDSKDIADKIQTLVMDKSLIMKMSDNARRCAAEKFDRNKTYQELFNIITGFDNH